MIKIASNGQAIVDTNYWDSESAKAGSVYLSWNAGAARLLVPPAADKLWRADMESAKNVIISRGHWPAQGRTDALEILFDDNSDNPFAVHIGQTQTDRLLPAKEHGRDIVFSVWTQGGKLFERPGKYRVVSEIPCLKAWGGS